MFLEQKSEKGEVCLDCAGVVGSHVGLSREHSFSVSSLIFMRGLFSNALLERISQDLVQNGRKNGLVVGVRAVSKSQKYQKIVKIGHDGSQGLKKCSKCLRNEL